MSKAAVRVLSTKVVSAGSSRGFGIMSLAKGTSHSVVVAVWAERRSDREILPVAASGWQGESAQINDTAMRCARGPVGVMTGNLDLSSLI